MYCKSKAIFCFFTNLLQTNLYKKYKNVHMFRKVKNKKNNENTQIKNENTIK